MMEWIKVTNQLPDPFTDVLVWDENRGFKIGSWIKRDDLPDGRMWVINGSSGGIDTSIEVYPPDYWCPLPETPDGMKMKGYQSLNIKL